MRDLWQDEEGVVLPLVAVSGVALIGFAALALDVGYWFDRSTMMSNVADMAAVSGAKIAVPIDRNNTSTEAALWRSERKSDIQYWANQNLGAAVSLDNIVFGCWNGASFTPNFNCPDAGAGTVAAANAVGIRSLDPNPQSFFAQALGVAPLALPNSTTDLASLQNPASCAGGSSKCYAVAYRELNTESCLITLSECDGTEKPECTCDGTPCKTADNYSMKVLGSINLDMSDCGIHVNGSIDGSNNDIDVDTPYICANGEITNVELRAFADNYCGVISTPPGPTPPPVLPTSPVYGDVTINNGESQPYSGGGTFEGLKVKNGGSATLDSGKYVFTGDIEVNGTLSATDATIILKDGAAIHVIGTGQIPTLTAPDSGDTAGYAIIENCTSSCSGSSSLGGDSTLNYQGNIYLPSHTLELFGNETTGSVSSTIIVDKLYMGGNADWSNVAMSPGGGGPLLPTRVHLVQ